VHRLQNLWHGETGGVEVNVNVKVKTVKPASLGCGDFGDARDPFGNVDGVRVGVFHPRVSLKEKTSGVI